MYNLNKYVTVVLGIVLVGAAYFYIRAESVEVPESNTQATASALRTLTAKWQERIGAIGPEEAYITFLEEASNISSTIAPHEQAHAFGEALYAVEGLDGLGYCDSAFEFGCYHSFFGIAVAEEGINILPEFKDACTSRYAEMSLPCQHGIGHGVLVYTDYENIVKALELCETISDLPTGGCSSGVFMEYNFHTMDESNNGNYIRKKTEDLYAPCSLLPERFQASCYFEQVQWWQNIFNNDFTYISTLCDAIEGNTFAQESCFYGIGNYVAAFVGNDVERIISTCATIKVSRGNVLCNEGASWLVRGDGSGLNNAKLICNSLATPGKEDCLKKLDS